MLKFFRRIRRKLLFLDQRPKLVSPTGKYLFYAFGEILLVMIGILLALQVNNWNERRIKRKQEIAILKQMNEDLRSNFALVEYCRNFIAKQAQAKDSILYYLEAPKQFEEKLKTSLHLVKFPGINFHPANTTYKYIENEGVNFISNPKIRQEITNLYDNHFARNKMMEDRQVELAHTHLKPLLFDHFLPTKTPSGGLMEVDVLNYPQNPEELKSNQKFINVLTELQELAVWRRDSYERTGLKIKELMEIIQLEIDNLE